MDKIVLTIHGAYILIGNKDKNKLLCQEVTDTLKGEVFSFESQVAIMNWEYHHPMHSDGTERHQALTALFAVKLEKADIPQSDASQPDS